MDEQQIQQQIIQLVQAAMQGDQQANQYIQQVMQAAQQGDQQAQQLAGMIQQVAQQIQGQQAQMAKRGAKLNYIRQLRGTCPEGYEMEYFKQGGTMGKRCKRCENAAKKQDGGEVNPVDAFKCGRKMKKVKKAQTGKKFGYVKQHDGDSKGSSEILRANEGYEQNPNIGDRTVYRIIQGNDTVVPVFSSGQFNGSTPIVVYDKTSPNFQKLNALFDSEKSKRVLDKYGTYFDEVKQVYRNK